MVKINVVSGFLGAGKTTLIKKLLTGKLREEKVILLENEYGEVGVDGSFMKDAGITVTELNSGCICCTLAGDFQKSIDELIGGQKIVHFSLQEMHVLTLCIQEHPACISAAG